MLRMNRLFICLLLGISAFYTYAQNTLNIHQKNGGMVSYSFADKPVVTYVEDNLHVSTNNVSIDYPLSELVKLTFTESGSSMGELRLDDNNSPIQIYDANGRSIKMIGKNEGELILNIQELPTGIYFIKQGTTTTKIVKQ